MLSGLAVLLRTPELREFNTSSPFFGNSNRVSPSPPLSLWLMLYSFIASPVIAAPALSMVGAVGRGGNEDEHAEQRILDTTGSSWEIRVRSIWSLPATTEVQMHAHGGGSL
jgi:hypothetical protein